MRAVLLSEVVLEQELHACCRSCDFPESLQLLGLDSISKVEVSKGNTQDRFYLPLATASVDPHRLRTKGNGSGTCPGCLALSPSEVGGA